MIKNLLSWALTEMTDKMMNNNINEIISELLSYETVTIITHLRPDGDTLGCAFALKYALEKLGKTVGVVCESEISPRYRFLSGGQANISNACEGKIICVDIASPDMAGKKYIEFAEKADIVIDHHETNPYFGKFNLINGSAAACGEIMYELISKLCTIDKCIAEYLYTAISTDTGCFVFANTTENTHRVASELLKFDINIAKLNKWLFQTKTKAAFEIQKQALETLTYFYDNKIVCMLLPMDLFKELNATEDDLEGLASIPSQIEGVIAAATFREIDKGVYKLSVRTTGEIHAGEVCKLYGGGGHRMAAGCFLRGEYHNLTKNFAERLFENLK